MAPEDRRLASILDAGCGSGSAASAALLCGYNVIAMDTSRHAIETTTLRLKRTHKEMWLDVYKEILKQGSPRAAVQKAVEAAAVPTPVDGPTDPDTLMIEAPSTGGRTLTALPISNMLAPGTNAEDRVLSRARESSPPPTESTLDT